jgi:hypothetical protein
MVMHTDFVIDQFARNIIWSGLCNITLHAEIEYKGNIDLFYSLNVGTLWDFKNCVTDNLFWAKLLYFGVFVKEIIQKLFLNHFIRKLSNRLILGAKFQFCQILSFQTNVLAQMYQA